MLDRKWVREHPDLVRQTLVKKYQEDKLSFVDEFLDVDAAWRAKKMEEDSLRKLRNTLSLQVSDLKKKGQDASLILKQVQEIPQKIAEVAKEAETLDGYLTTLLSKLPNTMHPSVPSGRDDKENVEIKRFGEPKQFSFPVKNHVELLEALDLVDFDASAKTSGNGFYFLKGELGLLNQALIRFAMESMFKKGYLYIEPPLMLHKPVLAAAVDVNAFSDTIYAVQDDDLCLIGTSEHSLLAMHTGAVFTEGELPKKYFSYSMCFRKEIGSHGINEKGLWRTHQFNKVEQFVFSKPEDSYNYYDEMLSITEEIFQKLGLPYRIIECCSGDLAAWKAKSADIEVWRPTTQNYGEVTSLSNCTDYQARDLMIRVDKKNGEREILHTLNNTAIATSRAMVAVIENYQNEDGSITVPEVLRPYMFGISKIEKKK